ncbi:MAG: hypothetical protein RLZZ253_2387 [Verrucomicrobiota bacterium]|jgi:DNA-binding transcriptional LysR family regulator
MELYQLEYFLEVARQRNFTRAAARLHLAQAALSEQVRKLEEELGGPLFVRGRRESFLTPAGEMLRSHAEILLGQAEVARRAVADLLQIRRGQLAVGSIPSVSACLFPDVVAGFRVRHPGVDLCLLEGTSEQVGSWVEEGRVQLGVVQLPAGSGKCVQSPLFSEPFLLLVPAVHTIARKRSVPLASLAAESFIFYRGRVREVVESACRLAGFEPRVACETGELETIRSLVAAGLGVALLPRLALGRVGEGCRVVGLSGPGVKREVALLRRSGAQLPAEGMEFQRLLFAALGTDVIDSRSRR